MDNKSARVIIVIVLLLTVPANTMAYNPFTSTNEIDAVMAPVITGASIIGSPGVELKGSSTGKQILNNINFTDVNSHWSKKYVYKMAARSVIRGYGSRRFAPEGSVTRQEVIALLVRIMGREGQVQQRTESTGITGDRIIDLWAQGYVDLAGQVGITTLGDSGNWKAPATRQEVAVWFARALKLEPVYGTMQQYVYNFSDWKSIDMQNLPYIEAVLQKGIMKGDSSGSFRPLSSVKRSEVAAILYNVADSFDNSAGFETIKGQVLQISSEYENTALGLIDTNGEAVTIRLPGSSTFPVFREDKLGDHTLVEVGDEITLIVSGGEVVYGEVENNGSFQREIIGGMASNQGWNTYMGTVNSIISKDEWNGEKYVRRPYYRVINIDGQIFDITPAMSDSGEIGGIPVYKNGKLAGMESLKTGTSIQYGVKEGRVYYISVIGNNNEILRGYFQEYKNGELTIFDYGGTQKDLVLSQQAKILINQRDASINDLKYGQEIELVSNFGVVTEITVLESNINPGYIPEQGKVRVGRVISIKDNKIVLSTDDGSSKEYTISGYTSFYKNGTRSSLSQLHLGDHVKVYLDDIYSSVLSRVDIDKGSHIVKCLAKGKLDGVSTTNGEIYLNNYELLENGRWVEKSYKNSVLVEDDTKIFYKGQSINLIQLQKQHKGEEVYLVTTEWFGGNKAAVIIVKDGYESVYKDRIYDINWSTGEIELKSNKNMLINQGTIIVANNRLIEFDNIREGFSVQAIVENRDGIRNALMIIVEDVNIEYQSIYVGRFNEIRTDEFDINYYTKLYNNEWGELGVSSDIETFRYDTDTVIVDVTNGYNIISAEDFFNGDYADDNKYRRDYDYYGFVVSDGDRASFIRLSRGGIVKDEERLYDDTLDKVRITAGTVEEIDYSIDTIYMKNSRNWSEFYGDWQPTDSDVYINYAKALIIKNNELINADDLDTEDNLYIIRDDNRGLIILVQ